MTIEVRHDVTCQVCKTVDTHAHRHEPGWEVKRPELPAGWRLVSGLGVVCNRHQVEAVLTVDGKRWKVKVSL